MQRKCPTMPEIACPQQKPHNSPFQFTSNYVVSLSPQAPELKTYECTIINMAARHPGQGFYDYHCQFSQHASALLRFTSALIDQWGMKSFTTTPVEYVVNPATIPPFAHRAWIGTLSHPSKDHGPTSRLQWTPMVVLEYFTSATRSETTLTVRMVVMYVRRAKESTLSPSALQTRLDWTGQQTEITMRVSTPINWFLIRTVPSLTIWFMVCEMAFTLVSQSSWRHLTFARTYSPLLSIQFWCLS